MSTERADAQLECEFKRVTMTRISAAWLVLLLVALMPSLAKAQNDPLSPLGFLVGDWIAVDMPTGESGAFTFKNALQNHVLVRTNEANYSATAERPASRHDDLLVVYSENGSLRADYFDSEGHVIRYAVQPRPPDGVVLMSDVNPHEPRYRLTYTHNAAGLLVGSFEVAAPGSPDAFKPYLSWKARRRDGHS
jgi:hypothetical protein